VSVDPIHLAGAVPAATPRVGGPSDVPAPLEARGEARRASGGEFGRMVASAIGGVNEQLLASQADLQQLAAGNVQNLHQIMIRLEESRLSFQLLLQVRNRLLEAYQDVMKMQV